MSRRAALEVLGLGAGVMFAPDGTGRAQAPSAPGRSRIASIDVFPVRYPMAGRFKFFEGPDGSPTGRPAVLVRVTDDGGAVGWGESVPIPKWSEETLETATTTIVRYLAPELIGRDATDIEGVHAVMDHAIAPAFSTGQPIAKAGIDIALHDLLGKRAGVTLPKLWHRTAVASLTLSWTVSPAKLEEIEPLVAAGREKGYEHFNVKVGTTPDFDVELCRRVRALAPRTFLWADANCGYDVETALKVAPRLADAGVDVLEAPLRPNRIQGYLALRRQRAVPILMDEGIVSPVELAEFIQLGMLDGVAMKPSRCGGLVAARRQIEMLRRCGPDVARQRAHRSRRVARRDAGLVHGIWTAAALRAERAAVPGPQRRGPAVRASRRQACRAHGAGAGRHRRRIEGACDPGSQRHGPPACRRHRRGP